LLDNETKYLEEISQNKEKEEAFRETLAEADIIMTNIENNYKTKVAHLEEDNALLQQKLAARSDTERFVDQLSQSDKSGHNRILLDKLFQKEKTELNLIEKIFDLEKEVKEISQKVCDEKILKTELDNTTKDQELNIEQIRNLETENKELLEEMSRYKEVQFKYQELLQSEGYLRGRIEELEIVEISLRDEFSSCELRSGVRERRLVEEINKLRDEIKQINTSASNCQSNCGKPWAGSDENLKMEYDSVKERLRDLTCQLEEKSKIFQDTESSLRTELSKARAGVTNTQRQLYEYDAENYQLKEKANHLEIQLAERYEELDKLRNQQERSNIEHSNVLTEKDRQIASLLESQREQSVEASLSSQLELSDITQTSGGLQSVDLYRCVSEDNILEIEMEGQLCADSEPQKEEDEDHLLEIQLAELTSKLDRMETEMCLVSEESKNLQQAVEIKDSVIVDQRQQLSELSQLVLTLERLVPQTNPRREARNGLSKLKKLQEVSKTDESRVDKKEVNLTLLPPEHPQLLRRVGSDGLLVSWSPPEDDEVTGYLIFVNSELTQKVRSANRTKALLHNLDLGTSMTISLHSINNADEVSQEVTVEYNKEMELLVTSKKVSLADRSNNQPMSV